MFLGFCFHLQLFAIDSNSNIKAQNTETSISNQLFRPIVYQTHDPIRIMGNNDFSNQAASEGWNGTGTITDPYIISGLNITNPSTTLIYISFTDVHFRISNCFLMGNASNPISYYGISCQYVKNGQIINNTICFTSGDGILSFSSSYNYITKNRIHHTGGTGIHIDSSNHCQIFNNEICDVYDESLSQGISVTLNSANNTIYRNTLYNNDRGISIIRAPFNKIFCNIVFNNTKQGIYLLYSSYGLIHNNFVFSNGDNGIELYNSSFNIVGSNVASFNGVEGEYIAGIDVFYDSNNNTITSNQVFNNRWYGVTISHSNNNTIIYNKIHDHPNFGIDINNNAVYNVIRWNDLYRNFYPDLFLLQASDLGANTTYEYNHWDSWTNPDVDLDGIVDIPYNITQDGTTIDPLPSAIPNHPYPHVLTNSEIIATSKMNMSEEITIEWSPSSDSWGHSVVYDLYYSPDNGTSWFILGYDISTTSYTWNCSSEYYLFVVNSRCSEGLILDMFDIDQTEKSIDTIPSSHPFSTVNHHSDTTTTMTTTTHYSTGFSIISLFYIFLLCIYVVQRYSKQ